MLLDPDWPSTGPASKQWLASGAEPAMREQKFPQRVSKHATARLLKQYRCVAGSACACCCCCCQCGMGQQRFAALHGGRVRVPSCCVTACFCVQGASGWAARVQRCWPGCTAGGCGRGGRHKEFLCTHCAPMQLPPDIHKTTSKPVCGQVWWHFTVLSCVHQCTVAHKYMILDFPGCRRPDGGADPGDLPDTEPSVQLSHGADVIGRPQWPTHLLPNRWTGAQSRI